MKGAGDVVVTFGVAADAVMEALGSVDGFDQAAHGDLRGREAQPESAVRAFGGFEESVAGEILEDFRQEVRGDSGFGGDGLGQREFVFAERGDVDAGSEGVFGGAGIDHANIIRCGGVNLRLALAAWRDRV